MATKQKIAPALKDNEMLSALVREAVRDVFEERKRDAIFEASLMNNTAAPRVTPVPKFKRIEDYSGPELDAAIARAEKVFSKEEFWAFTNGVDAFFERRRRRERGFGVYAQTSGTWGR
jgi:hypothetical protein